jgi:hypothetical protein
VFIDLSKAFDTVPIDILLRKLYKYGIRGLSLRWFQSLLSDRTQKVKVGDVFSDVQSMTIGVPQGSALGPSLFTLFMNDLYKFSDIPETLLFADDTAIIFRGNSVNNIIINSCLEKLTTWMTANRMTLNAEKTKLMVFNHDSRETALEARIGDVAIEQVNTYKYLGVTVDNRLSHKHHIDEVVSKANRINGTIYSNRPILPIALCRTIICALIIPVFSYCDTVYHGACVQNLHKLDVSFRRILRTCYRLPLTFPTNRIYRRTDFLPLLLQRQINCAKLSINIIKNRCAAFLANSINYVDYTAIRRRPHRATALQQAIFHVPRMRLNSSVQYLNYWAPTVLNLIHRDILDRALRTVNPAKNLSMKLKALFKRRIENQDWSRHDENSNSFQDTSQW